MTSEPLRKTIKGFDPVGKNDDWVTIIGVVEGVHSRPERGPMARQHFSRGGRLPLAQSANVMSHRPTGDLLLGASSAMTSDMPRRSGGAITAPSTLRLSLAGGAIPPVGSIRCGGVPR